MWLQSLQIYPLCECKDTKSKRNGKIFFVTSKDWFFVKKEKKQVSYTDQFDISNNASISAPHLPKPIAKESDTQPISRVSLPFLIIIQFLSDDYHFLCRVAAHLHHIHARCRHVEDAGVFHAVGSADAAAYFIENSNPIACGILYDYLSALG